MRNNDDRKVRRASPRPRVWTAGAVLAAALMAMSGAPAGAGLAPVDDALDLGLRTQFRDFELQPMDPYAYREQLATGELEMTLRGKTYRLLVQPAPWEGSYKIGSFREDGSVVTREPGFRAVVYLGHVAGEAGSHVNVVVTGSGVAGHVRTQDDYVLFEPALFSAPLAPPGLSVVFHAHEAIVPADHHDEPEVLDAPAEDGFGSLTYTPGPNRAITLWTDAEMRATAGANDRVWTAYNSVNSEYPQMVGWSFTVVQNTIYECTNLQCVSNDEDVLLEQFGNTVNVAGQAWSAYDLAHLFTGKAIGAFGVGYQPGRYGLTDGTGRTAYHISLTMAHEIAHNFNARHTRAERYTHMHGGTSFTHHTIMGGTANDNANANSEVRFELSSGNVNWMRGCNAHSWGTGGRAPGTAVDFGDRCLTANHRLLNGGAGPNYASTNFRGKLFTNAVQGDITQVCVFVDAGASAVVAIKPQANAAAPTFTMTIDTPNVGWNCESPSNWYWSSDSLFIYKTGGDARLGSDTTAPFDGRLSNDGGATWVADNVRRGFLVDIRTNTLPVETCGVLQSGASMAVHASFASCDGRFTLAHQGDGNVVLYQGVQPHWATNTVGATTGFIMQADGNLVLYNGGTVRWASNTVGHSGAWLSLRNDGVLAIYSSNGTTLWSTACGLLNTNQVLLRGHHVKSCDGRFTLAHQGDGNVVLYQGNQPLWATGTSGWTTSLSMQTDGNLVLYNGGTPLWASNTAGNPGSRLLVQNDGDMVIQTTYREVVWRTGTGGR